jgi:hypothetical protein
MEKYYGERMKMKDSAGDIIWTHVWKLMWNDIFEMRKFTRRSVLHELSAVNKAKWFSDARRLLQMLRKMKWYFISGEEDTTRFDVRRGRGCDISCQERKITSDSISGEEENITFDVKRGR